METEKKALPGVFELIKQSLSLYKKNFNILVLIGLVPVAYSIIQIVVSAIIGKANPILLLIVSVILGVVGFVIQITYQVTLIKAVSEIDQQSPFPLKEIYKKGLGLFWSFIWVSILGLLALTGSGILLFIPGLIVMIYIAFAAYTFILDGKRGLDSLSTSFYYVRGNWWRVFWRFLALVLIVLVIMAVIGLIFSTIAVLVVKSGNGFSYKSFFLNLQSYSAGISAVGIIFSIISGFISSCVVYPILFGYQYMIFKSLKLLKSEPNPETDLKKSRAWFKGLAIFGLIVGIALLIIPFSLGFFSGFKNARMKAQTMAQMQQSQQSLQSPFPVTATTLPISLGALEQKPYVNSDFGFSINLPKKWQTDANSEGVYIAPDIKKAGDADIIIEKKTLPAEAGSVPTEALMSNVAQSILSVASSSLTNVSFQKYTISSTDAYLVTGTLTVGTQSINVMYYFIRDGLNVYTITAEAKTSVWASTSNTLMNSVNTFKIAK